METFAKLFELEEIGQVLVKLDEEDNGPEVRIYFMPKGLGVCSSAFSFSDDEDESAWDKAEEAFAMVDAEKAEVIVQQILKLTPNFGAE